MLNLLLSCFLGWKAFRRFNRSSRESEKTKEENFWDILWNELYKLNSN